MMKRFEITWPWVSFSFIYFFFYELLLNKNIFIFKWNYNSGRTLNSSLVENSNEKNIFFMHHRNS